MEAIAKEPRSGRRILSPPILSGESGSLEPVRVVGARQPRRSWDLRRFTAPARRLGILDTRIAQPPDPTLEHRKAREPRQGFDPSPEWRAPRDRVAEQRGKRCDACGHTGTRIDCDHIVELRESGAGLDEANIRRRCGSCPTRKTTDASAKRFGLR